MKQIEIEDEDRLPEETLHKREQAASPDYFLLLIVASLLIIGLLYYCFWLLQCYFARAFTLYIKPKVKAYKVISLAAHGISGNW